MTNWAVFIGGAWHGRVYRDYVALRELQNETAHQQGYSQTGPARATNFGLVRIFSTDGADTRDQVWIRSDGPGEGLVVVLDGDPAKERPITMKISAKHAVEPPMNNRITGMLGPIDPPEEDW